MCYTIIKIRKGVDHYESNIQEGSSRLYVQQVGKGSDQEKAQGAGQEAV